MGRIRIDIEWQGYALMSSGEDNTNFLLHSTIVPWHEVQDVNKGPSDDVQ